MKCDSKGAVGPGAYALVTYIPEPLGAFLNQLRNDLVPHCNVYSHVTILPPRLLAGPEPDAWRQIQQAITRTPAFTIQPTRIEIFPATSVIYLAIGEGWSELHRLHAELNAGALGFQEPYQYHPHITLAQELPPEEVERAYDLAVERWKSFSHARSFPLDHVTFVQNAGGSHWLDLNECALAKPETVGIRV